jgi:H+/Cl- antiporter ClcA
MPLLQRPRMKTVLSHCRPLLQLLGLGALVGVACWPLNAMDRWQDRLLSGLPAFSGGPWTPAAVALACSPLLMVPLLLLLQRGLLASGAGSGIPQVMASIEEPSQADRLLGVTPTVHRLLLWCLATVSLLPLGREGPVVHMGGAVAQALRRRFPAILPGLSHGDLLALAGGAGLAGGFNTPLLGVVFVVEELVSSFSASLIWPALLVSAAAAALSSLGGQPEFALGMLGAQPLELQQLLWAVPIGTAGGLLGGVFSKLLLGFTRRCGQRARRQPLRLGLAVGGLLALGLLLSGGASGGDGELLMHHLLEQGRLDSPLLGGLPGELFTLVLRVLGPVLALGVSIPGGLIDPAFAFGALLGHSAGQVLGDPQLGLALGMTAGLAGATQLPVLAVLFALRLAGDQQLLPGILLAAVVAAYSSRLLLEQPVYHALKGLTERPE